jgi:hypothetical protein
MKALTIKQPWATLIMRHGKDVENRSWPTKFRGHVAIHSSSKHSFNEFESALDLIKQRDCGVSADYLKDRLSHLGAILGTAEIYDCVQKSDSPWFCGPYGFLLRDVRLLRSPYHCKGKLGFWDIEEGIEQAIAAELGDHL